MFNDTRYFLYQQDKEDLDGVEQMNDHLNYTIKIFPDMLMAAKKMQLGGAFRLWFLAKHFNLTGSGVINSNDFRAYSIDEVGITRSSYYGWFSTCNSQDLIMVAKKNRLKLLGFRDAAILVNCLRIGRPVYLDVKRLFNKGWQSWVWGGYIKSAGLENKMISRRTLRAISGIPERTQRRYSKNSFIASEANYAMFENLPGNSEIISGINEFERSKIKSKAFLKNGKIYWRRPNCYIVHGVSVGSKYSARRVNWQLADLVLRGGRAPQGKPKIRVNCSSKKQIKETKRRINLLSNQGVTDLPEILYLKSNQKGLFYADDDVP